MKKKTISMLLCAAMVVSMFAGCGSSKTEDSSSGGKESNAEESSEEESEEVSEDSNLALDETGNPGPYGKYEEPVTVELVQSVDSTQVFPEGESATDNYYTRYIKDNLNVEFSYKWQASSADFNEKFNLAIAANDLPDVMVVNQTQFDKMVELDLLEDLTPYYETYASDVIKENIASTDGRAMSYVTSDGKMLGIPGVSTNADGYSLMWIRQDWLDELGLEAPRTVEELEVVAKAFVDNKMGGENTIGIMGPQANGKLYNDFTASLDTHSNLNAIFQAYKSFPGYWIEGEDGEVTYGSLTPETKEALGKLQEMFAAGILDPELGIRESADETWKSGQTGIFFSTWWLGYSLESVVRENPEADWKAYTLLAEDGQWYSKMCNTTSLYCVVRKGYEHPEVAFLVNNLVRRDAAKMAEETTLGTTFIPLYCNIAPEDENDFSMEVLSAYMNGEELPEYDSVSYKLLDNDIASLEEGVVAEPYDDLSIEKWDVDHANFGRMYSLLIGSGAVSEAREQGILQEVFSLNYVQTEAMAQKWSNLKKKEDETFLKIIIGEEPLDAFDTFVEEWKAEGGDEIIQEVQERVNK